MSHRSRGFYVPKGQTGAYDRDASGTDWNTYPILDIEDAPASVEVILLNHPESEPAGAGESSIRLIAGAIGNAILEATGVRLRQAPLKGARFKSVVQALKENGAPAA